MYTNMKQALPSKLKKTTKQPMKQHNVPIGQKLFLLYVTVRFSSQSCYIVTFYKWEKVTTERMTMYKKKNSKQIYKEVQ